MDKKVAIIQSNFLPWKGYFDFIKKVDHFVFYDTCQFTKRDWRNRNKIKVSNGDPWISVSVNTKNKFDQKINETFITDHDWAKKIWNKIEYNYKKAPYFEFVKKEIFDNFIFKIEEETISGINQKIITYIAQNLLDIKTKFHDSSNFKLSEDRNLRLINITKELKGTEYISGEAAKCYLDYNLFEQENLKLSFMSYDGYKTYPQLHGEFNHFVTILDMFFMLGPETKNYLL